MGGRRILTGRSTGLVDVAWSEMPMARTPSSIRAMYASLSLCDVAAECFGLRLENRSGSGACAEFAACGRQWAPRLGPGGRAPCGGDRVRGGVPFGRAAFGSARLPRRLEPRQRGLFIVDHGARSAGRASRCCEFAWRNWSSSSVVARRNGPGPEGMRGRTPSMRALAPISATASASRLADAVVDASRAPRGGGLHRRCRDERTEVRARGRPPTSPRRRAEEPTVRLTADISLRRRIASCTASPRASRASHVDKYGSTLFVQSWRNPVDRASPPPTHVFPRRHRRPNETRSSDHHSLALQSPDPTHIRSEASCSSSATRFAPTASTASAPSTACGSTARSPNRDGATTTLVATTSSPAWVGVYDLAHDVRRAEAVVRPPGRRRAWVSSSKSSGSSTGSFRRVVSAIRASFSTFGDARWTSTVTGDGDGDVDGDVDGDKVSVLNAFAYTAARVVARARCSPGPQPFAETPSARPASLCLVPGDAGMAGHALRAGDAPFSCVRVPFRLLPGGGMERTRTGRRCGRRKGRKEEEEAEGRGRRALGRDPTRSSDRRTRDVRRGRAGPAQLTKTKFGAVDIENDYQSLSQARARCASNPAPPWSRRTTRPRRSWTIGSSAHAVREQGWARGFERRDDRTGRRGRR